MKPSFLSSFLNANLALDFNVSFNVRFTLLKRSDRRCLSFLKNFLSSKGIVKTNCLCLMLSSFDATLVPILSLYFLPHLGQNLDLHVKPCI